ncbi:ubiquitin-conjugating enzyme E2 24 [Spatholobus suberectus]|nr:ubiquitin-conjugating enzyme E2 24 [Spatholobus suberectus]
MDPVISDSDWETSSDSNSSEDQEEIDFLYGGKAQSILSSLEESIERIDDFLSFERAFVHGDVVCSLSDPSGQMGRVTSIDMFVDLESVKGKVLKNVNSKKLLRIRSISESDYVVKGLWLGRVQRVLDKVTVLFDDGAKCDITALEREKLLPLTRNFSEDSQYPYYPGQRVKVKSSNASKPTRWLCDTWRDNEDEGTVCAVEAGMVYVNWLAPVLVGCNSSVSAPQCWQDSKNLTVLSCFSHANWQLGDWCRLSVADQKEQIVQHAPIGDLTMEHCVSSGHKRSNLNSYIGELFIIGKIKTKVDVVWQNGEHTLGLDPENLLPVNVINNHEFWPHQFVLEKGASDDPLKLSSQRWGVVQCVDAKERTVKVQWRIISISDPENLTGDKLEEIVSAYEIVEHPDYSCFFGDIMFKAAQKQLGHQADKQKEKSVTDLNAEAVLKNGNQMGYQDEFPDNYFMSCIGNVTGFKDGDVEVTWATGFTTKVAPYEIFQIDKHEGSTVTSTPYETNVEELTQEMIEHGSLPSDQKGKDFLNGDGSRENCEKNLGECSSFSLPRAAFELFSSIKTSIFQTLSGTLLSGAVSSVPTFEENGSDFLDKKDLETCDLFTEQHPMTDLQSTEDKTSYPEIDKIHEKNDIPFSLDSNSSNQFKQFDVIENCPDHHFFDEGKGLSMSQVKRGWVKKVQQEWSILEKNLPETIYVRVFGERMDLMRAAIVGASGTPYHDGLFLFDICFPPEYPNEPPMVHYNSGGLRLNPNLYESGKICLSLLNTWTGTGTEVWNPGASTILQVLLSLQALVLNEKPYFNEAGYDQQIGRAEGEKNSVSYNENAFLVTTKSMMYLLRKPPKHFEALVEEHFRKRSQHILLACKAYLEGASIGCGFGCGKTEHENQKGTSTGFKIMLAKLFPKLVEAFSEKGIDCSQFVDLQ